MTGWAKEIGVIELFFEDLGTTAQTVVAMPPSTGMTAPVT